MHLSVGATVAKACMVTATPLTFGDYYGVQISSTATVSETCTTGAAYQVGLDAGAASGATVSHRSMMGPSSSLLQYSLSSDSAFTVNWGNTPGTDAVAGTGIGSTQALTVHGMISAGQNSLPPGSYSGTITVTLTY